MHKCSIDRCDATPQRLSVQPADTGLRLPFTKPITCGSSGTLHRHCLVQQVGFAKQSRCPQRQHRLNALPEALQGLAENTLARDSAAATVSLIGGLLLVKLFDFLSYSGVLDQVRWQCNRFAGDIWISMY